MNASLNELMKERAELLARFLSIHFDPMDVALRLGEGLGQPGESYLPSGLDSLVESVRYSALQDGGKRFRPVLAMLTAEALGGRPERVLPFAAAVECIHTYSLVHDDLPAMDNDDFRRGQPTNHKKFGEATAILAGDALLTEAFLLVADGFSEEPQLAVRAIAELSKAAGLYGMVGGQAIDMNSKSEAVTLDELKTMHRLKTGALIRVSAVGAAILCGAEAPRLAEISEYADNLGLAFQVADDILDHDPAKPEPGSYPNLLGLEKTRSYLGELTDACLKSLSSWPSSAEPLRAIAQYNQTRTK